MTRDPINILLIEDNPGDIRLIREALIECGMLHRLEVLTDGEKALRCLRSLAAGQDVFAPDLILLDLNLPKKDGLEVLVEIKTDETLRRIPVIVLSSSDAEADMLSAYNSQANCYICKPLDLDAFFEMVVSILRFWGETAKLPNKCAP